MKLKSALSLGARASRPQPFERVRPAGETPALPGLNLLPLP
ncbi:MAG: hypothetical protein V7641_3686 [Blastocatellia bacterium]